MARLFPVRVHHSFGQQWELAILLRKPGAEEAKKWYVGCECELHSGERNGIKDNDQSSQLLAS